MKKLAIVLWSILGICSSCQFFDTERISADTFYEEEYQNLNWNDVDIFPAFPACETISEKQQQQICFQEVVVRHFENTLETEQVFTRTAIHDTLYFALEVDSDGTILLNNVKADSITWKEIPTLHDLVRTSIQSLPKSSPAYKRGIPVKVEVSLPVILNSENL